MNNTSNNTMVYGTYNIITSIIIIVIISMAISESIYKAYFSGLNFRECPRKIWPEIWYVYVPPF